MDDNERFAAELAARLTHLSAERVDRVLRKAEGLRFQDPDVDGKYDSVDLDDPAIRAKLIVLARSRDVNLADLDRIIEEEDTNRLAEIAKLMTFMTACREKRDDLKVYYVCNTANRRLTVLAKDAACARHFARLAGHIHEEKNGRVTVLKPENEAALRKSGKALGRALRDGSPGVVKELGENVIMEEPRRVYTPMTVVDPD